MSIVAAEPTQFLQIPIPGPDSDPFYDQFVAYTLHIEKFLFMAHVMKNLFIAGGGTLTWDGVNGILNWTADFSVPVFHWGKKLIVRYGTNGSTRSATLQNGQALVVEVPSVVSNNVTVNFSVVSQLNQAKENQWVAGWRLDDKLYLKGMGEVA